ncbi:OmpA family protein [Nisaea acidiphila]|uniref:OmpA family protein n=1 Tax=Nisaea acidiphila TaxID=1862145 RepID=A0A9J7AXX6_9PROT|nr:OmpA family protein [Nisaea acidiphila]UUX51926.1 OmpA family protein [Nisaea acidiphila]
MGPENTPRTASEGDDRRSYAAGMRRAGGARTKGADADSDEESWMTTYTDMVTLLLTVFVILISMSTFEKPGIELEAEVPAVEEPENPFESIFNALAPETQPRPQEVDVTDEEMARLDALENWSQRVTSVLQSFLDSNDALDGVQVRVMDFRIIVVLRNKILFPSGSAALEARGRQAIDALADILRGITTPIIVEGHTDNVPISSGIYPSNWELSSARAASVVRRLVASGVDPKKLRAVGRAETEPEADNATPEGRARNRRVTLIITPRLEERIR